MVLLSGGVDSSTCLGLAVKQHGASEVTALSIGYGQKHNRELACARAVAEYYHVEHLFLDLTEIFSYSDSALLVQSDKEISKASYAEQFQKTGGSPVSTYVPFRNGLFLSAAASIAAAKGCRMLYYGAHSDDAAGNAYPDCSQEFFRAMSAAIRTGTDGQISLVDPFIDQPKRSIVKMGLSIGVPYELTWSCYEGKEMPCGECATCIDRAQAFAANGVRDPLLAKRR